MCSESIVVIDEVLDYALKNEVDEAIAFGLISSYTKMGETTFKLLLASKMKFLHGSLLS